MTLEEARLSIENLEKKIADLKESLCSIENEPVAWVPKIGDEYYNILGDGSIHAYDFEGGEYDECACCYGNCFKTAQRAKQVAEKFRMLLKLEQYHDMFCPDYVPDWDDSDKRKYFVYYDSDRETWFCGHRRTLKSYTEVYFDSFETVQKVCELLNTEN